MSQTSGRKTSLKAPSPLQKCRPKKNEVFFSEKKDGFFRQTFPIQCRDKNDVFPFFPWILRHPTPWYEVHVDVYYAHEASELVASSLTYPTGGGRTAERLGGLGHGF